MGNVALSSLRVVTDGDSTGYVKSMDDVTAANTRATASMGVTDNSLANASSRFERLQRSLDPAYAGQVRFAQAQTTLQGALERGVVDFSRHNELLDLARQRYTSVTPAVHDLGGAMSLNSGQAMALEGAVRHSIDAIISGRSPVQALAMEFGHLQYAMSGPGGATGALSSIGGALAAFVTPARLAVGGMMAIGAAAIEAFTAWETAQLSIATSLSGIGKAAGATVADINRIAEAHSSVSTISISEARNVAMALAETGKVTKESFVPILDLTKDFAVTMGQSVSEATKTLATAFADPVKGADELNRRLGFLDDSTKKLIESLSAQGDRQGAVKALTEAIAPSLGKASDLTFTWSQAWTAVANAGSDAFTRIGASLSKFVTGGSLDDQINTLQASIARLQVYQLNRSGSLSQLAGGADQDRSTSQLRQMLSQLDELTAKREKLQQVTQAEAEDKQLAMFSTQIADLIKQTSPAADELRKLEDAAAALDKAMHTPTLAAYVADIDLLPLALARTRSAAESVLDPVEKQTKLMQLQIEALDHRSAADRTSIAMAQKTLELSGQQISVEEKLRQVQLAGQLAGGGQSARDQLEIARVSTLGELATVSEKVNARQLSLNNANREGQGITKDQQAALKQLLQTQEEGSRLQEKINIGTASEDEIRAQLARTLEVYKTKHLYDPQAPLQVAAANTVLEKSFQKMSEQAALARSPLEQLKKWELDAGNSTLQIDTAAVSTMNQMTTSIVDFTTGAKTATQAFQDFGKSTIKILEEMIVKMLLARAIEAGLGALGLGGSGAPPVSNPYSGMPAGSNPTFHAGGMANEPSGFRDLHPSVFMNAPRFHSGIGPDEMPAIIRRDEMILTRGQTEAVMRAGAAMGGGGNNVKINVINNSGEGVKTSKRREGNTDVHEIVIGIVNNAMANGKFDGPLRARTGTQLQPRGR